MLPDLRLILTKESQDNQIVVVNASEGRIISDIRPELKDLTSTIFRILHRRLLLRKVGYCYHHYDNLRKFFNHIVPNFSVLRSKALAKFYCV